jgi:hypothetical protein
MMANNRLDRKEIFLIKFGGNSKQDVIVMNK